MKTQILTKEGVSIYDQEIKNYIKTKSGMGVTYTISKNKDNEIVLIGSDGSSTKISDDNTTYDFSQSGTTLTITPSDGSTPITVSLGEDINSEKIINALGYTPTSQSYVDNKLIISSTQPASQVSGEWLEILS